MAVPRPVLLALLGLALCAAAFVATRGARDPGAADVTSAPVTQPPVTQKAAPAKHPAARTHQARTHKAAKPAVKPAVAKPQPAKPSPAKVIGAAAQPLAVKVTQALGRGDAVVFFFTRPGPADDTGTAQAVRAARGRHVLIVRAGLKDLTTFRPVLSGAGVTQVPAVVVAHAGKPARLFQGYVDSGTLRQTIADALR
ncbi:MAG: hypothetical protein QOF37_755 [Thermoleophilaceae bacterium]|jgi:hypothetical protein|nr:hypothetical protein [Thermoleophilaceae bacterium]